MLPMKTSFLCKIFNIREIDGGIFFQKWIFQSTFAHCRRAFGCKFFSGILAFLSLKLQCNTKFVSALVEVLAVDQG